MAARRPSLPGTTPAAPPSTPDTAPGPVDARHGAGRTAATLNAAHGQASLPATAWTGLSLPTAPSWSRAGGSLVC